MVLMALRLVQPGAAEGIGDGGYKEIFKRALPWQLSFQCKDGGWAAFDKEVTKKWLEDIPFADHNAVLDPTGSDPTGGTLELLGDIGLDRPSAGAHPALTRIQNTQEDGRAVGRPRGRQ